MFDSISIDLKKFKIENDDKIQEIHIDGKKIAIRTFNSTSNVLKILECGESEITVRNTK